MGRPRDGKGGDQSNTSTSQETPRIFDKKVEKKHGTDSPAEPPEGTNAADTLISEFWLPEL